jgi:predicted NodU family carbamoyl transferase
MIILRLNAFHGDSSAALVRDGMLFAAAEEERFRRIKHWAGFPAKAIAYCLSIRIAAPTGCASSRHSRRTDGARHECALPLGSVLPKPALF